MIIQLRDNTNIDRNGLRVRHENFQIGSSASITLTKSCSYEKVILEHSFHSDMRKAALHFIFNGQTSFTQGDSVPPANFGGDKCNLMIIQPNPTVQKLTAKGDVLMASFYIELSRFISLLDIAIEALPEKFQRAIYKNVCSCNNFKWTPRAYYAVSQLLNVNDQTTSSKLFMESKMLELIAILLETEHCDYYSNITITKSDIDKIYFVQGRILSDLSSCFTHEQLARLAGTNEFVLKKGFREVFGKPVYQYLLQKRMEKAMDLLLTTHMQVSEIALLVGYEDASAFIRAFKRVFNTLPMMVRKNSFTA
ncbi:MAG: helix-turn-helix transcriptional regulator [Sphingobacteriales bacterium]|nr:MAG: helix-turn-helix transcriptional regulator [Sphingobacteriales bacterium]